MSIDFRLDWQSAPWVRSPELAATWCRLTIKVSDVVATLVEEREDTHGIRKSLDVPAYPLAEFLAYKWWDLVAPSHSSNFRGVRLVEAGSGFPWPDLTLKTDRHFVVATLEVRDRLPEFVKFLSRGSVVLDAGETLRSVATFIDATVRKLEESGVAGTPLQDEWSAIQAADESESDFCTAAASWGFDPYSMDDSKTQRLIDAADRIGDLTLFTDLARAVDLRDVASTQAWLADAKAHLRPSLTPIPPLGFVTESSAFSSRPWRLGYVMARDLRTLLSLGDGHVDVESLISVEVSKDSPPASIDALIDIRTAEAGVVVGPGLGNAGRRFTGARAIGRKFSSRERGLSLLTNGGDYISRVERAFAAEFLAPAKAIADALKGDFSDESQLGVAQLFQVSPMVIAHQVENQIAA